MKLFNTIGYHSSPYEMDKFENRMPDSKAKTGEGAMIHGWGLYIQSDKTINTERYKNRLSGIPLVNFGKGWINGRDLVTSTFYDKDPDEWNRICKCWEIISSIWASSRREGYSIGLLIQDGVEKFKEYMNRWVDIEIESQKSKQLNKGIPLDVLESEIKEYRDAVNLLQDIKMNQIYQYTVEFPDDMIFAEEDKTCMEQPEVVKKAIELRSEQYYNGYPGMYDDDDWSDFYKYNSEFDNGYGLCKFLSENGVDGIHYNGGRDGECWVVFNCEKIKIIAKE